MFFSDAFEQKEKRYHKAWIFNHCKGVLTSSDFSPKQTPTYCWAKQREQSSCVFSCPCMGLRGQLSRKFVQRILRTGPDGKNAIPEWFSFFCCKAAMSWQMQPQQMQQMPQQMQSMQQQMQHQQQMQNPQHMQHQQMHNQQMPQQMQHQQMQPPQMQQQMQACVIYINVHWCTYKQAEKIGC